MVHQILSEGMQIGKINLITRYSKMNGYTRWKCKCQCGNVFYPIESNLKRGLTKTCGNCGRNSYVELPDGISIEGRSTNGYTFYFDKSDLAKIKSCKWSVSKDSKGVLSVENSSGQQITTFLLGLHPGYEIDHIDRNRLNNRRSNLRICTHQQNRFNHNLQRNNTSGASGVCFNKKKQKYVARIKYCGLDIHLGYYQDILSAMQARNAGADFLFNEFAARNSAPEASKEIKDYVYSQCSKAMARIGCLKTSDIVI